MFRLIIALFIVTPLFFGCKRVEQEFSNTMREDAVIADVLHTPSVVAAEIGLTAFKFGGMGIDYGGNVGIRLGSGLQTSTVTVPEEFAVTLKWRHGQFIVTKKEIYEKFKDYKNKKVDVTYREIYRTTYEMKDGKKQVIERILTGYDFLGATIK